MYVVYWQTKFNQIQGIFNLKTYYILLLQSDPFFPFAQMQDPLALLHNPLTHLKEQFCIQSNPYVPLSQAIKQVKLHSFALKYK